MDVPTHDVEAVDWDRHASESLKSDSVDSGSDSEPEVERVSSAQAYKLTEARDCLGKLNAFDSDNRHMKLYTSVMDVSACLTALRISPMTFQKKITDFFLDSEVIQLCSQ